MGRPKGAKDKQPRKNNHRGTGQYLPNLKDNLPMSDKEASWSSRRIHFQLDIMPDRPLNLTDPNDIPLAAERLRNYLLKCDEYGMKVGNQAMYLALGVNHEDVVRYVNGTHGKSNPGMGTFLKSAMKLCATYREGMMEDGELNPVIGIFWQKNFENYTDQQQIVVTPTTPISAGESPERIAERYLESAKSVEMLENSPVSADRQIVSSERVGEPELIPVSKD